MTLAQRRLLEKFAAGDLPLNRAIRALLGRVRELEGEKIIQPGRPRSEDEGEREG